MTYYRHITDNGEIVLRQPLARPGFEEVGRDELAEAPGIRFGLNQDGFRSLFRNSIIAIGAKMTNKFNPTDTSMVTVIPRIGKRFWVRFPGWCNFI